MAEVWRREETAVSEDRSFKTTLHRIHSLFCSLPFAHALSYLILQLIFEAGVSISFLQLRKHRLERLGGLGNITVSGSVQPEFKYRSV